jgi:hypothetical protein
LKTLEKRNGKAIRKSREIEKSQSIPTGPARPCARAPASLDRWIPPVSGGFLPCALSLCPVGRVVGTGCLRPRAPLPLFLVSPLRQTLSRFPRTPALSRCTAGPTCQLRLPRAQPWTGTRALTPRSPATSLAHTPQVAPGHVARPRRVPCLLFFLLEPRLHPHSLPCPISHSPALSRALPMPLDLAGDPRPSCRSYSPSEAAPDHPELHPEVRHPFPCSVFPIVLHRWPISASPEVGRGGPPHPRGGHPNWPSPVPPRWSLVFPSPC